MVDCVAEAKKASGDLIDDDQLEEIFTDLQDARSKALSGESLEGVEAAILSRGKIIAGDALLAATIEKRNRLKNIIVENKLIDLINRADALTDNPSLGLEAALVGVNAPFEGSARSVDALTAAHMNGYAGGLVADLKRSDLLTKFNKMSGDFELEVARGLHAYNLPEGQITDALTGVGADARKISRIMHKYQSASIARLNREGGYIRQKAGYIVRQNHRPERLAKAGREAWISSVRGRLDFDKMGIAARDVDKFLDSAFSAIESGVRLNREISDVSRAFKGPGNLAKKDASSRLLEFKSPEDWHAYDQEFGNGSLREGFMSDLQSASKSTALMENFGTNPQAMLEKVADIMNRKYRDDPVKRKRFGDVGTPHKSIQNMMDEVTGDVTFGAGSTIAQINSSFRAIQTMSKLGGAAISAVSDIAFGATNRVYQGRSVMDAWGDAFKAPFDGLAKGEQRELADFMGVGLEGQLGDFMSRFNASDQVAGRTSKMMGIFFKLNLLGPWSDANKRGMGKIISRDLAMNAGKGFDDLPVDMRRMLTNYGLTGKKWELARQAVRKSEDGREYIMPGDVDNVTGAIFRGMSQHQQDRLKDEVRSGLFTLITNEVEFAVPSAGARERAILRQGYRPGTLAGEAVRYVAQFKSFGVTAMTKVMGRQVYGTGAKTLREQLGRGVGANMGLTNAIVMSTVMGYFVMQAKEMLKGRSPRENSAKTFVAAMLQGGGLGIYGDFIFGEASRFGGGPLETVAGPALGTVSDAVKLFQRARGVATGSGEDLSGDALNLVKSNIPFANLFYLKPAMDYMIWFQLQESINPGYLRRMERRIKRENNQTFWLPPSSVSG